MNGKVWVDGASFKEAFGIRGKLIDFVGTNSEAKELKNNYDEIIDINNHLVLPGLIDGHVHLVYGSLIRKRIDCKDVQTLDGLKNKIVEFLGSHPDSPVLMGGNLNIDRLGINFKTSQINTLDEIVSDRPLFISNYDYHSAICNTAAIEISGLTKHTDLINGDEVIKNPFGRPSGLVKENAFNFVFNNLPKPTLYEKTCAVEDMIQVLHSYGITSVSDITLPDDLEVYKLLFTQGKLKLHINSYISILDFNNYREFCLFTKEIDKEYFSIKGFKGFYDGALGSETALFKENYSDKKYNGYRTEAAESGLLLKLAKIIDKDNKQIIIHSIGDKAVSETLTICSMLQKENGIKDRRFRIEHAQHIDESDFDRFKSTEVIVSVQPLHMKYDMKLAKAKLPSHVFKSTHNYKNLIDRGVIVSFGTDFPIAEINPYENIRIAVTRTIDGETFTPENSIDLDYCIKAYTTNNAFATFNENLYGSISPGKLSDFVIMKDDLFNIKPEEISSARVWRTYFEGELVYSSGD
jgi:hypothetical protein